MNRIERINEQELKESIFLFKGEDFMTKGISKAKGHEFFCKVLEQVNKLDLFDVISKYVKAHKNTHGDSDALCPFHGDEHFGNFKISQRKGIYKCFTCDAYGDGIQFVRELFKLPFKSAVMKIAVDQGIVTQEQAEGYLGGDIKDVAVNIVTTKKSSGKPNGLVEVASVGQRDIAYRILMKMASLSEEHRSYLRGRGLSDEEIKEMGLFSFPDNPEDINEVCRKCQYTTNAFKGVPGFHSLPEMKTGYVHNGEDEYRFTFRKRSGIGLPHKDALGYIKAIQIRQDNPSDKQKRYTWFSSAYAGFEDNPCILGSSAGAPTHIAQPREVKYKNVLFITEGFFKAEAVAKKFQTHCISVSGVGNFRSINNDIADIVQWQWGEPIEHIYVAYDADMSSNVNVFHHAKRMVEFIREKFPEVKIYQTLWNEKDGKGIDDLIQNGQAHTLRKVDFDTFSSLYDKMVEPLVKEYGILQRIPKDIVEKHFQQEVFSKVYHV